MKIYLAIYLIGVIWGYLCIRHDFIHNEKTWRVKDLAVSLICGLFSWLVVIFNYCYELHKSGAWNRFWNKNLPPWI